jgi:molybdenum cofactor cytidylyltransferase
MFFPCDQPLLDETCLRLLLEHRSHGHIVEPSHNGMPSSPTLFSHVFRDELIALESGEKGRDIKNRHRELIVQVEIADGDIILADVDDPASLKRLEGVGSHCLRVT